MLDEFKVYASLLLSVLSLSWAIRTGLKAEGKKAKEAQAAKDAELERRLAQLERQRLADRQQDHHNTQLLRAQIAAATGQLGTVSSLLNAALDATPTS